MHSIDIASWLVVFGLVELSMGIINMDNATWAMAFKEKFPELLNLSESNTSTLAPGLGGQHFSACCMLAMQDSLNNRSSVKIQTPLHNPSSEDVANLQMPGGAIYSGMLLAPSQLK